MTRPRSPIWHPFTQHALMPEALHIARAEGQWLESRDGRRILDAISSWWVVTHGHRHPRIMEAIAAQTEQLDQVIFAGCTHEPAERLAERLIALVNGAGDALLSGAGGRLSAGESPAQNESARPPAREGAQLQHVFFSDSGSTAVEVAIKMALGFWRNIGAPRTRILALEHAYHGDTIGTMSAGARSVFNASYEPLLFDVVRIPFPAQGREAATLDALDAACRDGSAAALIAEPLLLGAGGMLMYAPDTLSEMKLVCEGHGTLFIADEVMTGWGRTGTLLACEQAGISPDILCLAKGLTGGSLPLAVTLCTGAIFDAHLSADRAKTFFHSSSYTANPICCAAALANVDIWESEPVSDRIAALAEAQARGLGAIAAHPRIRNARRLGTITAVDIEARDGGYLAGIGPRLYAYFLERGILLRPLGNTVYVMPPYCTTAADLDLVYGAIADAADALA